MSLGAVMVPRPTLIGHLIYLKGAHMEDKVTKWDLISDKTRKDLENTPFGHPCTGCNELLATEADFAKHFILYDRQYRNLGYCPVKGPGSKSW